MSKSTDPKMSSARDAAGVEATSSTCTFEGKLISIAGNRLEIASDRDTQSSYALASDALLTCDGWVSKEESLQAGRRIRVTTQKDNSSMVTGIEWLNNNRSFPALKTAVAK